MCNNFVFIYTIATTAVVKTEYIKKAMQKCVLSANKMSKKQRWIWHSVLREGQALLQLVELLPESMLLLLQYNSL